MYDKICSIQIVDSLLIVSFDFSDTANIKRIPPISNISKSGSNGSAAHVTSNVMLTSSQAFETSTAVVTAQKGTNINIRNVMNKYNITNINSKVHININRNKNYPASSVTINITLNLRQII